MNDKFEQPSRLAIKLQPKAEAILKKGHPWIFSESLSKVPEHANSGDVALIFSQKDNKLIGVGLYDADSPIRIKVLSANKGLNIDQNFFNARVQEAYSKRLAKLPADTNAYRIVYGESDGLPGLICDLYDQTLVMKLYSTIWLPYVKELVEAIATVLKVPTIVLRLGRNVAKAQNVYEDGQVLLGELVDPVMKFVEHNVAFQAHLIKGHKTGYFLDHRANRYKVGQMAKNSTMLDVFAYAGGFSVHALAVGARSVCSVDVSAQALALAAENASLNTYSGKHTTIKGDAFEVMRSLIQDGVTYDIVVIDPPSFAKQQSEITVAIKQYEKLATLGAQLTQEGGVLVLASCSSRVDLNTLKQAHTRAFKKMKIHPQEICNTNHDFDHPISIPESSYLKTVYYQF